MPNQNVEAIKKVKGNCLCGAISFEVSCCFDKLYFCSCSQCRQITGSAFASNLFVRADGFKWVSGKEKIKFYQLPGRDISKSFCRDCGSGVPWASSDRSSMIVPAGTLSGSPDIAERLRIFVAELPSWASELERLEAHEKFPT